MSTMQGLSGVCILADLISVNSYVPVGTWTALGAITSPTRAEKQAGALYGEDIMGMAMSAQVQTRELIMKLTAIMNRLPAGDGNIALLQTLIADLS
jgi:hypothetical protein